MNIFTKIKRGWSVKRNETDKVSGEGKTKAKALADLEETEMFLRIINKTIKPFIPEMKTTYRNNKAKNSTN